MPGVGEHRAEWQAWLAVFATSIAFLAWRYSVLLSPDDRHFQPLGWDFMALFWHFQIRNAVGLSHALPYWDHGFGAGRALLNDPQSMYWHPASLFASWLSDDIRALYVNSQRFALLQLAVFMTGTFALARRVGGRPLTAGLAAVTSILFTESIATRYEIGQLNSVAGGAILPWGLLAAMHRPSAPSVSLPIALFCGMSLLILAGPSQQNLVIVGGIGSVLLYTAMQLPRRARTRVLTTWGLAAACSLSIFAPVMAANLDGVFESGRWQLGERLGSLYSSAVMEPAGVLRRLLVPFGAKPAYIESTLYIGAPLLFAAALAAYGLGRRRVAAYGGLIVFLLVYAMGDQTPAHSLLLQHLPVLSPSGLPGRILMFVPVLLVLAPAAIGTRPGSDLPGPGWTAGVAVAIAAVTGAAAWPEPERVVRPLICLALACGVFALAARHRLGAQTVAALLGLLVLVDIGSEAARMFRYRYPPDDPMLSVRRTYVLDHDVPALKAAAVDRPVSRFSPDQLGFGWNPMIPLRLLQYSSGQVRPEFARAIEPPDHLAPIENVGPQHHYAYVYRETRALSDAATLLAALHDRDVFDPDELLLMSSDSRTALASRTSERAPRRALPPDAVRLGPDAVDIELETRGDAHFLFLSMYYDAGWRARVDGREVNVLPAFHAFTAVPIEQAGRHHVRLDYVPGHRRATNAIRVLGIILAAVGLVLALRVRRRRRPA